MDSNKRIFIVDKYITPEELENLESLIATKKISEKINIIVGSTLIEKIKYIDDYNSQFESFNIGLNLGCKDQTPEDFINRLPVIGPLINTKFKIGRIFIVFNLTEKQFNNLKAKLNVYFNKSEVVLIDTSDVDNQDEKMLINKVASKIEELVSVIY